jgi:hypothetical protein
VRDIYLGDSYDLVKRFWSENLRSIAPLFAHPKFVPIGIKDRYTTLTKIPLLDPDSLPNNPFAIFLDPHTGIPLPSESLKGSTVSHASLLFIVEINKEYRPSYMICFNQSYHRRHQLTKERQREAKRAFLREQGIASFYYISHAPFLFMAEKDATLVAVRGRLIELGIPEKTSRTIRLEVIMS